MSFKALPLHSWLTQLFLLPSLSRGREKVGDREKSNRGQRQGETFYRACFTAMPDAWSNAIFPQPGRGKDKIIGFLLSIMIFYKLSIKPFSL